MAVCRLCAATRYLTLTCVVLKTRTSYHVTALAVYMSADTPRSYQFEFSAGLPSGGWRGAGPPPPESHVYPAGTWGAAPASHSLGHPSSPTRQYIWYFVLCFRSTCFRHPVAPLLCLCSGNASVLHTVACVCVRMCGGVVLMCV